MNAVKRVLISPAPAGGWPGERCRREMERGGGGRTVRFCVDLNEVVIRCQDPGLSKCRYDFETQTFIDDNGNRWATNEYNKLVE